jgi:nucleotide-binding universal stress UspA family protein
MEESAAPATPARLPSARPSPFARIVCGVDGSPSAVEAVRQASLLRMPGTHVVAVAVCETHLAVHGAHGARQIARDLWTAAADAALEARELAPLVEARVVEGDAVRGLIAAAEAERATLIAVGSNGLSRSAAILMGGVSLGLVHRAPTSVHVARGQSGEDFPRSVVVGVDGSPESFAAAAAASELRDRCGATVQAVVATGGKAVDVDGLARCGLDLTWDERRPVDALLAAAADADLLLVGSRGLHGVRALGSVSERVAAQAPCSVLVLR